VTKLSLLKLLLFLFVPFHVQSTKAVSLKLLAITGLGSFVGGSLLVHYLIKRSNSKQKNHAHVAVEAQQLLTTIKAFLQEYSAITNQLATDLTEDQRVILELQLIKKIVGAYHGTILWPFYLFEHWLINDCYVGLNKHLLLVQQTVVKLKQENPQSNELLADLQKIEQEILIIMPEILKVRTCFCNSSCYRLIEALPCIHIGR
jgi:hypothetical protein